MPVNAAGLNVSGSANPNWQGGLLAKVCETCLARYSVKRARAASRFCSLQCVGRAQRKAVPQWSLANKTCEVCGAPYSVPRSHAHRYHCCSNACGAIRRGQVQSGTQNPNWRGGLSRLPYPWNFREISKRVIQRDHETCQGPECRGIDRRLTTHHIDYNKGNCSPTNLITLCSSCNSRANFDRPMWAGVYVAIMLAKKHGGGWEEEEF